MITVAASALAIGSATAQGTPAPAATPPAPAAGVTEVMAADAFAATAGAGIQFDLAAGQLGVQRATSEEVRDLARRLVEDHAESAQQLLDATTADGTELAIGAMGEPHSTYLQQLQDATGEEFDRLFIQHVIAAHRHLRDAYQGFVGDGAETELREFAVRMLPIVEEHLRAAENLAVQLGVEVGEAGMTAEPGMVEGQIVVEQQAPGVFIQQGETRVFVTQAQPEVTVQQNPPRIIVRQPPPVVRIEIPEPRVTIDMPEPEVIVDLPDPNVAFNLADPEIRVEQTPPQVEVVQAPPTVDVNVPETPAGAAAGDVNAAAAAQINTEENAPIIEMGVRPEAAITIERGEPVVTFEPADPRVEFTPPGDPNVQVNRIGELTVNMGAEGDAMTPTPVTPAPAPDGGVAMAPADPAGEPTGAPTQVTVEDLLGLEIVNENDEVLGDVEQIAVYNGETYVILGRGGLLGIGEQELAVRIADVTYDGERLIITGVTPEQLDEMGETDLEPFTMLEPDQTAEVQMAQ